MLNRTCLGHSPDCWYVAQKVVSLFSCCFAGDLSNWPSSMGTREPEFLVEQGFQVVAQLPPFLLWILLSPTLVLDSLQYYVCSLTVFFFLNVCTVNKTSGVINIFYVNHRDFACWFIHFLSSYFRRSLDTRSWGPVGHITWAYYWDQDPAPFDGLRTWQEIELLLWFQLVTS